MRIAVFSTHCFETLFLLEADKSHHHAFAFFNERLTADSVKLAAGFPVVSCFVTEPGCESIKHPCRQRSAPYCILRSAGFNHINLAAAKQAQ